MTKALTLDEARDALRRDAMYGVPIPEDTDPYVFMTSGDLRKALRSRDATIAALKSSLPDLSHVISWLENGCEPAKAADELRIYQGRIAALSQDKEGSS